MTHLPNERRFISVVAISDEGTLLNDIDVSDNTLSVYTVCNPLKIAIYMDDYNRDTCIALYCALV